MRYVQILSRFLTAPYGAVVSQERLNMNDDKLDEFIAAGYAIEYEMDEEMPPPSPTRPQRTVEETPPPASTSGVKRAIPPARPAKRQPKPK